MNPLTADEMAALRSELSGQAYAGLTDAQAWEALHARPLVSNPVEQGQISKPFSPVSLMLAIGETRWADIKPFLGDIAPHVAAQNANGIRLWAASLATLQVISSDDVTAIEAVLNETIPDPHWPAQVRGSSRRDVLFPGRVWADTDPTSPGWGSSTTDIPILAVTEARNS